MIFEIVPIFRIAPPLALASLLFTVFSTKLALIFSILPAEIAIAAPPPPTELSSTTLFLKFPIIFSILLFAAN